MKKKNFFSISTPSNQPIHNELMCAQLRYNNTEPGKHQLNENEIMYHLLFVATKTKRKQANSRIVVRAFYIQKTVVILSHHY